MAKKCLHRTKICTFGKSKQLPLSKWSNKMEAIKYEDGRVIAERNFAQIKLKGKKFIERNAEIFIRRYLMIPYYITEDFGKRYMHIIHTPDAIHEKVFFKKFLIDE